MPISTDTSSRSLEILVLEDGPDVRSRLVSMISEIPGFEVPRVAASLREARDAVRAFRPDVALLDLHLPDGSGLEILHELRARTTGVFIAVISVFGSPQMRQSCLDAGADAFFSKASGLGELSTLLSSLALEGRS